MKAWPTCKFLPALMLLLLPSSNESYQEDLPQCKYDRCECKLGLTVSEVQKDDKGIVVAVKYSWTHTNPCFSCRGSSAQRVNVYEKRGAKYHKLQEFQLIESPAQFNPEGRKLKIKAGDGKLEVVCYGDCDHKVEAIF